MNEPQYLREAGSAAEIPSVNVGGSGGLAPSVVSIDAGTTTMPLRERREKPRISETPPVPPPPPNLDDYEPIIGRAELGEIRYLTAALKGKTVKMVNSTAVGGGVAEMLNRIVPLLAELEVATHWDVITGGNDFFEITKAFHNALHGGKYDLFAPSPGGFPRDQRAKSAAPE